MKKQISPLRLLMRLAPRRWRADMFLLCLVLVAVGMAQSLFGGGDSLLRWLSEEPAVQEQALTVSPEADVNAPAACEALEPDLSCEGMPETGEPVRFLMQNVQNYFAAGERQQSRYVMKPKPEAERNAVADGIAAHQPDVVGLTEMAGPVSLADLRARLEARGLVYPYFRVLAAPHCDRNLAILSRLPIVADASQARMPLYGQHRSTMMRGLLDVTVRTEDGRLFRIMGAHLKSRVADDPAAAAALRSKEAHTVAAYVQQEMRRSKRMPLLLFGDWNDTPEEPPVRLMVQGLSKDAALRRLRPRDGHGEEWTLYYRRGGSYYVFDHLFVNPVLWRRIGGERCACGVAEQRRGKAGSDHRALWCDLR